MRKVFGHRKEEVWRKLHHEEFHNVYSLLYQGDKIKEVAVVLICRTREGN